MIRLTVTLIVAIYIVLIVVPPADHGDHVTVTRAAGQNWLVAMISDAEAGAQRPPSDRAASAGALRASLTDGLIETADGFALATSDGTQLEISAVINPIDLLPRGDASAPEGSGQIWRVAANAVNFRDGPSTNTNVLTSLTWGEEVEFLASAADDWAHLRVLSTGMEGYMAAQFLEPVN